MITNPFEDDTRDAMDDARERDIERLKQTPVFTPHCPACYSGHLVEKNGAVYACGECGYCFLKPLALDLRPLPPSPAPSYTQEEINELADLHVLAGVWWTLKAKKEFAL